MKLNYAGDVVEIPIKEAQEILQKLCKAAKAARASNCNSASVEDPLTELADELQKTLEACPHGYVYKLQCATCRDAAWKK